MSHLNLEDLSQREREEIDKALAMLNPYLAMSKVDWSIPMTKDEDI
jgi:hypothetical protein